MFVDASALVAILLAEPDGLFFIQKLQAAETRSTSALAVWETSVAVSRGLKIGVADATNVVETFLRRMDIGTVAVPPESASVALDAFDRYGKGRHPAGLNFGDCFAYACAKVLKQPLLFKGDDFALSDIERA